MSTWLDRFNQIQQAKLGLVGKAEDIMSGADPYGGVVSGAGGMMEYPQQVDRIWEEDYLPAVTQYAEAGKLDNQRTLERELARLRMRMGYNQSAGAGTAGWWNLARGSMLNAAAQKQFDINTDWQKWMAEQELGFRNLKDEQRHQENMEALRAYYHNEALKLQAELNDPTWWETLGTIVGYTGMLWGWAGFPWFSGTTEAGGIVGGGVGGSWSAATGYK